MIIPVATTEFWVAGPRDLAASGQHARVMPRPARAHGRTQRHRLAHSVEPPPAPPRAPSNTPARTLLLAATPPFPVSCFGSTTPARPFCQRVRSRPMAAQYPVLAAPSAMPARPGAGEAGASGSDIARLPCRRFGALACNLACNFACNFPLFAIAMPLIAAIPADSLRREYETCTLLLARLAARLLPAGSLRREYESCLLLARPAARLLTATAVPAAPLTIQPIDCLPVTQSLSPRRYRTATRPTATRTAKPSAHQPAPPDHANSRPSTPGPTRNSRNLPSQRANTESETKTTYQKSPKERKQCPTHYKPNTTLANPTN